MTPFRIDIPQDDLDDLRERLARTRWTEPLPGDGWQRGVPLETLRELAGYWRDGFDWRVQEARLNAFPQFMTTIDGLPLHFVHVRSGVDGALPIVLNHGWPNSFVEFATLIEPLRALGYDLIAPSIPGFGFSGIDARVSVARVAGLFVRLVKELGYTRFGVEGGDLGAYLAPEMAIAAPDACAGVYVIAGLGFPTEADVPEMTEDERAAFAALQQQDWMTGVDHHALLRAAPQTFAYGWHDSPIAALAWMTQKFHEFGSSPLDRDLVLTNLSLYWFTRTFGTSSWPMYSTTASAWPRGQKAVPTGVYSGPPGIRRLAERHNTIVHWPADNPAAHHFVAMERPHELAADLDRFFATVHDPR